MPEREFSVVTDEALELRLRSHLVRSDGQEDMAFLLYYPIAGANRDTARICDVISPEDGDRFVHGTVGFSGQYFARAVSIARRRKCGLAIIHSHPKGRGWQGLSADDDAAERRIAAATLAATGLPLAGLTLGSGDTTYSARRWMSLHKRAYARQDASNVRIIGRRLTVSLPPGPVRDAAAFERTESVWGKPGREMLTRLRFGIVGLGSVGSIIAEVLARIGVSELLLVDHDTIELRNLDRTLNATIGDLDTLKVAVAATAIRAHAPGEITVREMPRRCDDAEAFALLLDCDVIFCCVDRPWPRRILNQLSYANLIPVSNGGIRARTRKGEFIGADWHVHTVGPGRRCLQCWRAFDPADAALEYAGLLDDPTYVQELDAASPLLDHANAIPFSMSVASMQVMQVAAMLLGPSHDTGDQNFHASTGVCETTADRGCDPGCPYETMAANTPCDPPLTGGESNS